jgi:hypothetical protein
MADKITTRGHDNEGQRTETQRTEYSDGTYKEVTWTDTSKSSILSHWEVTQTKEGKTK